MNKLTQFLCLALCSFIFLTPALAENLRSCYKDKRIDIKNKYIPPYDAHLYVLIDETTLLGNDVRENAYEIINDFLDKGITVSVFTFSSNIEGRYMKRIFRADIGNDLTSKAERSIAIKYIRPLKLCQKNQKNRAARAIKANLSQAFDKASTEIPYSEIIYNLKEISDHLRKDKTKEKYILIISDMLEHSSITSFYKNKSLKPIDAEAEIAKVKEQEYIADFGGISIYVIGGGQLGQSNYISSKLLNYLEDFWVKYFELSNATLAEFGTPNLLDSIERSYNE